MHLNAVDNNGRTALMWCSCHGHTEVVHVLLENKHVNERKKDDVGSTAYNLARENGHFRIARAIANRAVSALLAKRATTSLQ
jgi:ankyrin repeat protein